MKRPLPHALWSRRERPRECNPPSTVGSRTKLIRASPRKAACINVGQSCPNGLDEVGNACNKTIKAKHQLRMLICHESAQDMR